MNGLYATEMTHYATVQRDTGQDLCATHRADSLGLCTACGRSHPCDGWKRGRELVDRYGQLLAAPAPLTDPPYAANRGRV